MRQYNYYVRAHDGWAFEMFSAVKKQNQVPARLPDILVKLFQAFLTNSLRVEEQPEQNRPDNYCLTEEGRAKDRLHPSTDLHWITNRMYMSLWLISCCLALLKSQICGHTLFISPSFYLFIHLVVFFWLFYSNELVILCVFFILFLSIFRNIVIVGIVHLFLLCFK